MLLPSRVCQRVLRAEALEQDAAGGRPLAALQRCLRRQTQRQRGMRLVDWAATPCNASKRSCAAFFAHTCIQTAWLCSQGIAQDAGRHQSTHLHCHLILAILHKVSSHQAQAIPIVIVPDKQAPHNSERWIIGAAPPSVVRCRAERESRVGRGHTQLRGRQTGRRADRAHNRQRCAGRGNWVLLDIAGCCAHLEESAPPRPASSCP